MPTKYDLQFKGIIHIQPDGHLFHDLMRTLSDFILKMMSDLNEEQLTNPQELVVKMKQQPIMTKVQQIILYSQQEIMMIRAAEAQTESREILMKILQQKQVLETIFNELNNVEQLKDFCSRIVDFVTDVSKILQNVDKWNVDIAISYIEKLKQIMKTLIEYKKQNAGRQIISSELDAIRPNADKITTILVSFLIGRCENYGEEEGEVKECAMNLKVGEDDLFKFILGEVGVDKVKIFKEAMDSAVVYLQKEFQFGVVVNVERKDQAEQAMMALEKAQTQEEKDRAAIELLNELEQRAEMQKDEGKRKILAKVTREKKKKKTKNYGELLSAARKLSENVDNLKEVVYHTDENTCIDVLDFSQLRDLMLSGNN